MFRTMMIFPVTLMSAALPVFAQEKLEDASKTLEHKMLGAWKGYGPCDGQLILNPDGTYQRKWVGPGGDSDSGTWSLNWDALPPTLMLNCKQADFEELEGTTIRGKVLRLDNERMEIHYEKFSNPIEFNRIEK